MRIDVASNVIAASSNTSAPPAFTFTALNVYVPAFLTMQVPTTSRSLAAPTGIARSPLRPVLGHLGGESLFCASAWVVAPTVAASKCRQGEQGASSTFHAVLFMAGQGTQTTNAGPAGCASRSNIGI